MSGFTPTRDKATNEAIGAAAFKATASLENADTLLLTRVVTRGESDKTCATVFGRAIKIRKTGSAPGAVIDPVSNPENRMTIPPLDREMISATVQAAMREIRQCATFDHGAVKVSVVVAANGTVSSVTVVSAPKGDLGECVANEMKKAVFPPSRDGATFTYPFDL